MVLNRNIKLKGTCREPLAGVKWQLTDTELTLGAERMTALTSMKVDN